MRSVSQASTACSTGVSSPTTSCSTCSTWACRREGRRGAGCREGFAACCILAQLGATTECRLARTGCVSLAGRCLLHPTAAMRAASRVPLPLPIAPRPPTWQLAGIPLISCPAKARSSVVLPAGAAAAGNKGAAGLVTLVAARIGMWDNMPVRASCTAIHASDCIQQRCRPPASLDIRPRLSIATWPVPFVHRSEVQNNRRACQSLSPLPPAAPGPPLRCPTRPVAADEAVPPPEGQHNCGIADQLLAAIGQGEVLQVHVAGAAAAPGARLRAGKDA